jgi:rhodanese-related sulfurtransferase
VKKILILALLAAAVAIMAGCALDVIATGSVSALDMALGELSGNVTFDGDALSIASPDGDARFVLRKDWSGDMDALLAVNADPLLAAGLDASRLPEGYLLEDGTLYVGRDLGDGALEGDAPLALYKALIARRPDALGFHAAMGHFGIDLGGGMFEWARNLGASDKDVVYVLHPDPLVSAGLDPEAVDGWVYAQIETMDAYGAKISAYKLLKPFDIA